MNGNGDELDRSSPRDVDGSLDSPKPSTVGASSGVSCGLLYGVGVMFSLSCDDGDILAG